MYFRIQTQNDYNRIEIANIEKQSIWQEKSVINFVPKNRHIKWYQTGCAVSSLNFDWSCQKKNTKTTAYWTHFLNHRMPTGTPHKRTEFSILTKLSGYPGVQLISSYAKCQRGFAFITIPRIVSLKPIQYDSIRIWRVRPSERVPCKVRSAS